MRPWTQFGHIPAGSLAEINPLFSTALETDTERAYLGRMTMQRQVSPIPPGRYWIIVNNPGNIADFDSWLRDMQGGVRVETTSLDRRGSASSQFIIFNVPEGRSPFLSAVQFGFPNIAGPEIRSREDVIQRPDPIMDPLDRLPDPLEAAKSAAQLALLVGAVLLLLALKR